MQESQMKSSEEPAGSLLPVAALQAVPASTAASTAGPQSCTQAAAKAVSSAATACPTSTNAASGTTAAGPSVPIPRFLQQLFEQEEQRRLSAPSRRQHQQDGKIAQAQQGVNLLHESIASTPAAMGTTLLADSPIGPPTDGSTSQMPGLAYSASSAASSDTSSFPADMIDSDARPAAPTSLCSSVHTSATAKQPFGAATSSLSCQARPAGSTHGYASSASSTAGDDSYAGHFEAGSTASRSTSPATKSVGAYSTSTNGTGYTYSSPSTSPYFNSTSGLYHPNHAHHYLHSAAHQGNLHLQPLKLPPPSLDLPESTPSTSSTTPSCDTLSAAFNGFKHTTSPLGWNIPTASTSQNTTPGAISPEASFSPGGRTSRPRQQHYSPLHPFHQQGFLSPHRSRSLTTPRTLLGPDLCDSAMDETEPLLRPPDNFAMVSPGVYRSSFPSSKNFEFLKRLGLKTVLTLVQEEEYPQGNRDFFKKEKIRFLQIGIPGNKVSQASRDGSPAY